MQRMILLIPLLLFSIAPLTLTAQAAKTKHPASEEMMKDATWSGEKFTALLSAMPDTTLDWRPAEGARSIREVFTHIADANYFFMTFVGGQLPDDPNMPREQQARENRIRGKADLLDHVTTSFQESAQLLGSLTPDQLNTEVDMFGRKVTARLAMLTTLGHMHEHLGQAIAYARMNGITPPWSEGE